MFLFLWLEYGIWKQRFYYFLFANNWVGIRLAPRRKIWPDHKPSPVYPQRQPQSFVSAIRSPLYSHNRCPMLSIMLQLLEYAAKQQQLINNLIMMNFFLLSLFACCLVVSWHKRQKTKEQNKSCWCRQRDVCDVMHGLNLQWGSVMQLRQSWLVNSNATSNFTKGASLCTYSYKWAGNNCKKARRNEALTLSDKFKSFFLLYQ